MTDPWDEKPEKSHAVRLNYGAREMEVWLINLKAHYASIEKQAETLRLLFGEKGIKIANLEKLQIWRSKAEKWDELCECLRWGKNTPVENILLEINAVNQGNQQKRKKLEAIKNHMKDYPSEKDKKYSGRKDISTEHYVWNMPYFLTDLDTWHKKFKEILGGEI